MSTKTEKSVSVLSKFAVLIVSVAVASATWAAADEASGDEGAAKPRVSETIHFKDGGRANERDPSKGIVSNDEFDALKTGGERGKTATKPSSATTGPTQSQSSGFDFWFYDADVDLFYDDDGDGYYYGVDLWFDADTIYSSAEVYAVVYLSFEGGPWNEYAASEDFTLHDTSATDDYVLVTELISGYPTGEYDLLLRRLPSNNSFTVNLILLKLFLTSFLFPPCTNKWIFFFL